MQNSPASRFRVNFRRVSFATFLVLVTTLGARIGAKGDRFTLIPNGVFFPNPGGASQTYSATSGGIDLTGPFFQSLGSNGRSCGTCHQPSDGMSVSAAHVEARFFLTAGRDPIFRPVDGSNCNHNIDLSTLIGRYNAYSLLRTRGLIRVALQVPANADYVVTHVNNPYGCSESDVISVYRRPLPATNLRFLSAVMFDGRESSAITGTTKILYNNYPDSLLSDLAHQSLDATMGHAEGDGSRPTPAEQQEIVKFEMGLTTAQAFGRGTGFLHAHGANGGPLALLNQPFFISINSSVHPLVPSLEQPGGLVTPGDGQFSSAVFGIFDAWQGLSDCAGEGKEGDCDNERNAARASVARGQAIFNSKSIDIRGAAGINDDLSAGGLVAGGIPSLTGTCGTCHDTPSVGNHSFPTPLNIGTGDPDPSNATVNAGGLDISYLPLITVCKLDPTSGFPTSNCKTTSDLARALIVASFDHVGKFKGPILRGCSARAPYS